MYLCCIITDVIILYHSIGGDLRLSLTQLKPDIVKLCKKPIRHGDRIGISAAVFLFLAWSRGGGMVTRVGGVMGGQRQNKILKKGAIG